MPNVQTRSRGRTPAASLLAVLALAAGCDSVTRPAADSRPTPILFESFRPNDNGLHLVSTDGRRVVSLARLGYDSRTGDWSPDGRRIVITRFGADPQGFRFVENEQVWLANADGSSPVQLTQPPGPADEPQWSPDGRTISYTHADDPFTGGINAVNIDGTGVRRLPNTANAYGSHDWSPDGRRIVFARMEAVLIPGTTEYRSVPSLFIADTAGAALVRLTTNTNCGDLNPEWSPDGARIAFSSCVDNKVGISVINADGTAPTALTAGSIDQHPTWSPDGRQIAFQSERAGNPDIWLMSADGSNMVNLTASNPGIDRAPKWSRSVTLIAVVPLRLPDEPGDSPGAAILPDDGVAT